MVFLFSALSCIPVLIPSHSSDPPPKGRLVFHIFSKSITMETHGSLLCISVLKQAKRYSAILSQSTSNAANVFLFG